MCGVFRYGEFKYGELIYVIIWFKANGRYSFL